MDTPDVLMRGLGGDVVRLPYQWAVLLAENLRTGPLSEAGRSRGTDVGRLAADKIEKRLTDDDPSPVEFDDDEMVEVMEMLEAICGGWHKAQGGLWMTSDAQAFASAFRGDDS